MGVKITPMYEGDPECDMIRAYCLNTAAESDIRGIRIFKYERKGEAETFK